ncbi:FG-GAP-like repeat-containing protein [Flavobacterium amniphilum]|uniref:FG-GAP-like repeat-containing protein n=1 Tax=Flavobacterium amniphilum TaxID=1834035 RepID=UPI00202A92CC|nr:FG-GAP-like repeat-containing protein [Flavobacterium amniphilum]MCL9806853.1 FG-GAP-like repeat-containing protein [Flavobacterium amniphilum]
MKKITLFFLLIAASWYSSAQDTCASALAITAGIHSVSAVNGSPAPTPVCTGGNLATFGEWYSYTPSTTYSVTVSSDIAANTPRKDTRVHIYTGICGALTCYAGDDDTGSNYSSVVTFVANAGTTYYIAWDNRWNSAAFSFQLTEAPYIPPPPPPISYTPQTITTVNSTYNICVVDMNNDYKDDIVGVSTNNLKIHHQTGPATFSVTNYPVTGTSDMPTWSMAAGDYNRDGYNDLVLGSGSGLSFWQSNNDGTTYTNINPTDYIFCQRTNFVDINNDGNLDAFSCHDVAPNVYYLNNGSNAFTHYQSGVTPGSYNVGTLSNGGNYASLWTDYDNDGDVDLFISKCSGPPCELHRNDGNGVFTDISAIAQINTTPVQSWSSAVADFDNDGDMDIFVGANGGSGHKFFRNNLDTTNNVEEAFTNITAASGVGTDTSISRDYIAYDFDNDGKVDIMGGGNKIFFNQGNNVFSIIRYPGMAIGSVGDLNSDGFLDIANNNKIYYAAPNGNNWLKVSLIGIQSNKNGIGARIEIYGAWGKQIRDVRSGEGFEYMSTLNAHFGIGTATQITQVIIRWPSGTVDTITNPNPNQTLLITEGSTLGIDENTLGGFTLYPNPANDFIRFSHKSGTDFIKTVSIFDMAGRVIKTENITDNSISVHELQKGTYMIILENSNGNKYSSKFIKE